MIVLLVMTDGRDALLARALASFAEHVTGPISRIVVHDDTGEARHRRDLTAVLAGRQSPVDVEVIGADQRLGFGGAIDNAWAHLRATAENDAARFVFHLEDDFLLTRDLNLAELALVLDKMPHLQQMALRRQAWNEDELAAGGLVEAHPDWYTEHGNPWMQWLEQRVFFTTNPSLYRRSLTWRGWPTSDHSEGKFALDLLAEQPDARFGYWGARDSGVWVEHIGVNRAGIGY